MSTWLKDTELREEVKQKDFSEELKKQYPLAENLSKSGKLNEGIELLLTVEKQARLANDLPTLKETCKKILELCYQNKDWECLKEQITLLAKRRAQKSAALTIVVQQSMDYLKEINSEETQKELIVALRLVSDGKIYVEKERALLTQQLSQIYERNGEIASAADILQEVHVETYGAMTKLEKCEFILEQVRLTLAKKDYIRSYILSKKILRRTLEEENFQQCKLKFYHLMIQYHTHENDTLELSKHWEAIFNTPIIQNEPTKWQEALKNCVLFLLLSPYSNHQHDMLHRLALEKKLTEDSMKEFYSLVNSFTTKEIIPYPMKEDLTIKSHEIMNDPEYGKQWYSDLRTRVIEHNLRVIAEYYDRIRMPHLAQMLGLTEEDAEINLSNLVSNGTIYTKIDRPAGIVSFQRPQPPEEQMSNWSADISQLLKLVETTCHLINKENMTYKL